MVNDLVADMLTRIRNASRIKQNFTNVPYSKVNVSILEVMLKEKYVSAYIIEDIKPLQFSKQIRVIIRYNGWGKKIAYFSKLKRISKQGRRVYCGNKDFSKKVSALRYQQGIAIVSTSSGVMTHLRAAQLKLGGEILCYIE